MPRPSDPQTRILDFLNSGAEASFEDLKRLTGLSSERHLRRILKQLRETGTPIEERRTGKYKHFIIPEEKRELIAMPLHLNEDQVFALTVAAEAARLTLESTPLREPLREAFKELLASLTPNVHTFEPETLREHWHFGAAQSIAIEPSIFRTISRAIEDSRRIRIDYLTASTGAMSRGRMVDPLAVAVLGGTWLLVAFCHIRRKVIDFALAGISKVQPCDETQEQAVFTRPADFDPELHFRDRFRALSGDDEYVVRILVPREKAVYFERKLYNPTQQIESVREDGQVVVSFEVSGLEEIRSFIESWGPAVTVLEPKELVDRLRADAAAVLAKYDVVSAVP